MTVVHPDRHLLRARDLVDARYREELHVPTLARVAHFSPAQFSREFRRGLKQLTHAQVWVARPRGGPRLLHREARDGASRGRHRSRIGNFRWLSVGVPGQPDVAITLMVVPGAPVFDDDTRKQIHTLLAKGAAGGLFFATDDCQASYEDLKSRGVEQEPTEQPYGIDAGLRDPSGKQFRMGQRK